MSNMLEISLTSRQRAGIYEFSLSKQDQLIKQGDDIAAWLMNGEDHSSIIVSRKGDQTVHNVECIVRIQPYNRIVRDVNLLYTQHTTRGFIQKENGRASHELACYGDTSLFSTRDRSAAWRDTELLISFMSHIAPESPILESLISSIPNSCIVSNVRNFFASRLMSLGSLSSAEYKTVS
jgi:hypothetical protein